MVGQPAVATAQNSSCVAEDDPPEELSHDQSGPGYKPSGILAKLGIQNFKINKQYLETNMTTVCGSG